MSIRTLSMTWKFKEIYDPKKLYRKPVYSYSNKHGYNTNMMYNSIKKYY